MQHQRSLYIFRRDLRLEDNTALITALKESREVVPAFIFDPRQYDAGKNKYFSAPAFAFLLQALNDVDQQLRKRGSRLHVYEGRPDAVVRDLIRNDGVQAVYMNKDHTPFARARDTQIQKICEVHKAPCLIYDDTTLSPIEQVCTQAGTPYTVFTPFMRKARTYPAPSLARNTHKNYISNTVSTTTVAVPLDHFFSKTPSPVPLPGGRSAGLRTLRNLSFLGAYGTARNIPAIAGTSGLSPHHRFGTISIRETYHAVADARHKDKEQFVSELYWRDFYYHIAHHFPHVFGAPLQAWGEAIPWRNDAQDIAAWEQGMTGVPIVDAGMRQLNTTGWMHNRVRMIVASFLVKNLLVDWRIGEQYFARHLVDYDPSVNNGSWQWSAQVGTDPRPLRIFNPYTQAKNYDPEGIYIQQYVPELRDVESALLADGKERSYATLVPGYPAPIVDIRTSYHRARDVYTKARHHSSPTA
jgi:deoxyribodipyrimidine photo-lyase